MRQHGPCESARIKPLFQFSFSWPTDENSTLRVVNVLSFKFSAGVMPACVPKMLLKPSSDSRYLCGQQPSLHAEIEHWGHMIPVGVRVFGEKSSLSR